MNAVNFVLNTVNEACLCDAIFFLYSALQLNEQKSCLAVSKFSQMPLGTYLQHIFGGFQRLALRKILSVIFFFATVVEQMIFGPVSCPVPQTHFKFRPWMLHPYLSMEVRIYQ